MQNVIRKTTIFILFCFTIFALAILSPIHAQTGEGFSLIGQFGGRINALSVEGDMAYVVMGTRLAVFDMSDPAAPTLIGKSDQLPSAPSATAIDIEGTTAYIAVGKDGLITVDISNPTSPIYAGSFDTGGNASHVQVVENVAYVTGSTRGLIVADVSDPAAPTLLGGFYTDGDRVKARIVDNIAYIIKEFTNELLMVDMSDPAEPILLDTHEFGDSEKQIMDIQIEDNVAYIILGVMTFDECGPLGLVLDSVLIVDVGDLHGPVQLGSYYFADFVGYDYYSIDFDVVNNVFYILNRANGLKMIDVSDPTAPTSLGTFNTRQATDVQVVGDVVYIADHYKGLVTVDVSDPAAPAKLGTFNTGTHTYAVDVVGDIAYLADGYNGLVIMDISDPTSPSPLGSFENDGNVWGGYAQDVQIVGTIAYIAYAGDGLVIVDISDPTSPRLISTFKLDKDARYRSFNASSIHVVENIAYMTDSYSSHGLTLIDVSDPSTPLLINSIQTPNSHDVYVVDGFAYIADGSGSNLTAVDVGNLEIPVIVSSNDNSQNRSVSVHVVNHMAYVANGEAGLEIFEVSDPVNPIDFSVFRLENTDASAISVHVVDDVAYVLFAGEGLAVIDVSIPHAPTLLKLIEVDGTPLNVYVEDDVVYVSLHDRGMFLLEHVPPRPGGDDVAVVDITIGD